MIHFYSQVLADDSNQDKLRSVIAVFKPLRAYLGVLDADLNCCFPRVIGFDLGNGFLLNFNFTFIAFLNPQDSDMQRKPTASVSHALYLASGRALSKLMLHLDSRMFVYG